jgi:hypothetical protein
MSNGVKCAHLKLNPAMAAVWQSMAALPNSLVDTHQAHAQARGLLGATCAKGFAEQGGIS